MSDDIRLDIKIEDDEIPLLKMDVRFSPDQLGVMVLAMREYNQKYEPTSVEKKALEKIERQSKLLDQIWKKEFDFEDFFRGNEDGFVELEDENDE